MCVCQKEHTTCQPSSKNFSTRLRMVGADKRIIPFVAGLSVYGSRRAAPHEPNAPAQTGRLFNGGLITISTKAYHTISKKLDASEIQATMAPVVNELLQFVPKIRARRDMPHKIQPYLLAKRGE